MLPLIMAILASSSTAKADEAIHKYLVAQTTILSERFMDGAKTKAEWEAKRPKLKEQFLEMLGLWPLPEKTPLKATVTRTFERGDVAIENIHFQSKPGLYVTGNLYRPKTIAKGKRLPAIVYVCGHSGKGRDGNKTAFQDHGLWFASHGYVCMVLDTLQLGEIAGKHHGTYNLNRFWWQNRGYTPAGVECWNGIRAIDYLCSRPDVDPDRIGVTGISGGGATTVWIAAADERVKVAVPVSGMSDLESYVSNKVINGHCDCMFFVNTYQWEWTTALALHAPKPLLLANSDNDPIFPMDGNRRIMARMRKCFDLLGHKDLVDEYVSKGGHDYRPDLRLAIFGFFNKHLKRDHAAIEDADFAKIDGKELRVFPEDKDLPKDSINDRVDELFVPVAEVKLPTRKEDFPAWKAGMIKRLRETSFRAFPEKVPPIERGREVFLNVFSASAESGVDFVCAEAMSPDIQRPRAGLFVLNPDEQLATGMKFLSQPPHDKNVFKHVVSPRGGLQFQWTKKNPPNTVERSLALLGQTADSGRVRDIAAIYANSRPGDRSKYTVAGWGRAGVIAGFARLMVEAPPFEEFILIDPPTSFRDGPFFLNIDRVIDLPTALGLLAPEVKLTLINAKDKAFDKTAALYKLAGAEEKFVRK